MDIKEQLAVLFEICKHDLKLFEGKKALAKLGYESGEAKSAASDLAGSISELRSQKENLLKRRKNLDERLQLEKSNLRKWESRAEKIKGEREYTALMSEISAQKRTIFGLEAEIKESSEEMSSIDAKVLKKTGAHEEKVEQASTAYDLVKEQLRTEEDKLSLIAKARNVLLEKIPKPLARRYLQIYEKRSQQGIAFLHNQVCQACMRAVPPELFIRVCREEVIEQCPSCLRILVANSNHEPKENG